MVVMGTKIQKNQYALVLPKKYPTMNEPVIPPIKNIQLNIPSCNVV